MIDERLTNIENQKNQALTESNNLYQGLMNDNKNLYDQQNNMLNEQMNIQNGVLDKQLEFQKGEIEKQKEKAQQNYETESKKALNDYTAFNNPYGYQAEQRAQMGLNHSGMSETSKLGSFNVYQNRLATANKVTQDAFIQFDSDLNQARLNNDVQKAQNALEKLKMQLQYAESYNNKNSELKQNQYSNNLNLDNNYYNRYQDTVSQINYEKEQAEKRRQYEEQFAYQKEQDKLAQQNWEREYALSKQSASSRSYASYGGSSSYSTLNDTSSTTKSQNIKTPYYSGLINPDTKYGTFSSADENGVKYQPNNVSGSKLSGSGMKVSAVFDKAYGQSGANLADQQIWKSEKGGYYIWDGSRNSYIDITSQVKSKQSNPHQNFEI